MNEQCMHKLTIGYAKVEILPDYSIPLGGFGNTSRRMSTGYEIMPYATCAALTDEADNTVLVYGIDLGEAYPTAYPGYRARISEAVGIPEDHIFLSNSHTHAACDMYNTEIPSTATYIKDLGDWLLQIAHEALADRKPATMQYATVNTKGINFIRRYVRADGTYTGSNFGFFSNSPLVGYESEPDPQLQLLKFVRQGGKDIIMTNFQMHPHRASACREIDFTAISADLVGIFREELESALDVHVLYFTGASGNLNPISRIGEHNTTANHREQAKRLAQYAIELEDDYTEIASGPIRTASMTITAPTDHSQDHKLAAAQEAKAAQERGIPKEEMMDFFKVHQINSYFAAGAIVQKAAAGPSRTIEIWAFAIGDMGFAAAPYEMFDTSGMFIKEHSPFTGTFVLSCTNTHHNYMPTVLAWQHGGYEVDQCFFAQGTAELLAESYVDMLKQLK